MSEPFRASVQYDDLKGHVALDGYDGPPLQELAKHTDMPAGYFPVGLELWKLQPNEQGMVRFRVVAVDTSDMGHSFDEIVKYAQSHDELAVYPFDGEISAADFAASFKRFRLTALRKELSNFNVIAYSKP